MRHAQAISNFLEKTSFVQVKHDLFKRDWSILKLDMGPDFTERLYSVAIVHYVNKNYIPGKTQKTGGVQNTTRLLEIKTPLN